MGWASKRNGELLALAAAAFDVFLTVDRNLSYQKGVSLFDIAVVVLVASLSADVGSLSTLGVSFRTCR